MLSNCEVSCNIDLWYDDSMKGKHCLGTTASMIGHLAFTQIHDGRQLSCTICRSPYVPCRTVLSVYLAGDESCLFILSLILPGKGKHCLGNTASKLGHPAVANIQEGKQLSWIIGRCPYLLGLTVLNPADDELSNCEVSCHIDL